MRHLKESLEGNVGLKRELNSNHDKAREAACPDSREIWYQTQLGVLAALRGVSLSNAAARPTYPGELPGTFPELRRL